MLEGIVFNGFQGQGSDTSSCWRRINLQFTWKCYHLKAKKTEDESTCTLQTWRRIKKPRECFIKIHTGSSWVADCYTYDTGADVIIHAWGPAFEAEKHAMSKLTCSTLETEVAETGSFYWCTTSKLLQGSTEAEN